MGATLLFWGWQTGFIYVAVPMALILESSRFIKARWEFSDDEFARIWTFSFVLLLAAVIFAFNNNGGPSGFGELLENPNVTSERDAGNASTMTADALFRWLPMIFFLFIAAQTFSPSDGIALEAVSPYLRSRLRKARKKGFPLPPSRRVDVSYPFFALCLFSAGGHAPQPQNDSFYYGFCILIAWALWPKRSQRFVLPLWAGLLAVAAVVGFWGQREFTDLVRMAGQYDPQLLSYLWPPRDAKESRTDIGNIGLMKLSGKIIIRLEAQNGAVAPAYLREASYREPNEIHRQLIWQTGNTNNDDYPQVYETPRDSGNWPLNSDPANRSTVTIACYLNGLNPNDKYPQGLLPLPADCNRLENTRAYFIYQNNIGAVLAEGPRLMIFDSHYGSGSIMDSTPEAGTLVTNQDLRVPLTNEIPALQQVISQLNVANKSDDDKILAVSKFFADNFTYSLWQVPPRGYDTNATPLARFLLETRSGHCEYFATATVLLLRELGIPARYAVGYYVHETSGKGYVIRMRDAHAWCVYWDQKKHAWQTLDTTPGTWVALEGARSSPFQFLSDFQSWVKYQVLKFFEYGHSNIRGYLFWALVPALVFLLYRIFRNSRRHRKNEPPRDIVVFPGLDSEFYRLEKKLAQKGLPRQPGEPLSLWLQRTANDSNLAELKAPLEHVLQLHYRYRFDPRGLDPAERQALRQEVEACLTAASVN